MTLLLAAFRSESRVTLSVVRRRRNEMKDILYSAHSAEIQPQDAGGVSRSSEFSSSLERFRWRS